MMEAITPELLIEQGKAFKEMLLPLLAEEEMEAVLRDTPYVQRIQAKSREKGREEGREEGQREALTKTLSRILATRFAIELDHFTPIFEQLPVSTLEALSETALTVDTLIDFEAKLNKITSDLH